MEGKLPPNEVPWWVCEGVVLNNLLIDSLGIDSSAMGRWGRTLSAVQLSGCGDGADRTGGWGGEID